MPHIADDGGHRAILFVGARFVESTLEPFKAFRRARDADNVSTEARELADQPFADVTCRAKNNNGAFGQWQLTGCCRWSAHYGFGCRVV